MAERGGAGRGGAGQGRVGCGGELEWRLWRLVVLLPVDVWALSTCPARTYHSAFPLLGCPPAHCVLCMLCTLRPALRRPASWPWAAPRSGWCRGSRALRRAHS